MVTDGLDYSFGPDNILSHQIMPKSDYFVCNIFFNTAKMLYICILDNKFEASAYEYDCINTKLCIGFIYIIAHPHVNFKVPTFMGICTVCDF